MFKIALSFFVVTSISTVAALLCNVVFELMFNPYIKIWLCVNMQFACLTGVILALALGMVGVGTDETEEEYLK